MNDVVSRYLQLIDSQQSLQLATYATGSGAQISYAPYVRESLQFFIFVSELAAHTRNLREQKQASVMFIEPETEARNVFARERVIFNCHVETIAPSQHDYELRLEKMQQRFGEIMVLLRSLKDFQLMVLQANSGQYIKGFGQAYQIDIATQQLILNQSKQ